MTYPAGVTIDRARPEEYQPELTRSDQAWRLLACLALSATFWSWVWHDEYLEHQGRLVADVLLGVAAYAVVLKRRRYPLTIALATNVAAAFSALAGGPAVLAAVSLATRRKPRELLPLAIVIFTASLLFDQTQTVRFHTPFYEDVLYGIAFVVLQLGWGMYIGSRRELVWVLQRRAERAEAERDERVRRVRAAERTAIAREMHDVLGHRISQISLHAGALTYRDDLDAQTLRAGAAQIQASANEALRDLRAVLGVLRGAEAQPGPPTYPDIAALVAESREQGTRIDLVDDVERSEPVPDQLGRALYRIVQEGITNARKHASGAPISIRMTGSMRDGIELWIRNPLGDVDSPAPAPGTELGLVGLRERAELSGGRFDVRRADREHVLHTWLPWRAT